MIGLNTGFFKPMFIITSAIALPLIVACWIVTFTSFRSEVLITSLIFVFGYFAAVFGIYKYSKNKKEYICVKDGFIVVNHFGRNQTNNLKINLHSIVKMEYYKITSLKAWCMLYNYVCPQCVFITYEKDGKELCELIGYPDCKKVKEMCNETGIAFYIK